MALHQPPPTLFRQVRPGLPPFKAPTRAPLVKLSLPAYAMNDRTKHWEHLHPAPVIREGSFDRNRGRFPNDAAVVRSREPARPTDKLSIESRGRRRTRWL